MYSNSCTLPPLSDILAHSIESKPTTRSPVLDINNLLSNDPPTRIEKQQRNVKAKRKRASPTQLLVLNRIFSQTYFPSTEIRIELGKQLGMSPRTVQIWFQNKRQALRSRGRHVPEPSPYYLPPISPPRSPQSSYFQQEFNVSLPPLKYYGSGSFPSPSSVEHHF
ncbi:uncharacterized protein B0P05DRAFT_520586 [Gilbertella persicaria]|uniref:uncharacterized protein n=1 Tax=Gilbertella persicaria TaxID=101096 RepID=UPI00221F34D4|nr:uncharacterized protein B0P05DRAFT_520586 [Gilbertella persicaria]KAI8098140.1 hypothetical protein B0P05DRAFT_520586 [Gilbertella persicaria]